MTDNNTPQPSHDLVFRKSLADKRVAKDFLLQYVPLEMQQHMDLETLAICNETYIDKALKEHQVDVLYRLNIQDKSGYLYLLLEHQSYLDQHMPFRLFNYAMNIMRDHLEKHNELPIVYPMVFYHGKRPYSVLTDLFDLFYEHKELAKQIFLQPHHLIDVTQISDDTLKKHLWSGTLSFIFKHVFAREFLPHLEKLKTSLIQIEQQRGEDFLWILIEYVINKTETHQVDKVVKFIQATLSEEVGDKTMTIAEQLRLRGYQLILLQFNGHTEQSKISVRSVLCQRENLIKSLRRMLLAW